MKVIRLMLMSCLVGGCVHPNLQESPPTPAPRTWDGGDHAATKLRAAEADEPPTTRIGYPAAEQGPKSDKLLIPRTTAGWQSSDSVESRLRHFGSAAAAWDALPMLGGEFRIRRSVWPSDAAVAERNGDRVRFATTWIDVTQSPEEIRCAPRGRSMPQARLTADIILVGTEIEIRSFVETRLAAYCVSSALMEDRLRGYSADILLGVRGASRAGTPVPLRR